MFAQPLYVPSLAIAGVGKRNVVFAATEHDSVYAFDVNGTRDAPLWKTSFVDPQHGTTALTEQDVLMQGAIEREGVVVEKEEQKKEDDTVEELLAGDIPLLI